MRRDLRPRCPQAPAAPRRDRGFGLSDVRHRLPPRTAHGRSVQRGFTLIEVIVVLVLVAAMTLLVATMMTGGLDGMRMRTTAKEIAAELRHARAQAIARSEVQQFLVDPKARTWTGVGGRSGDIPDSLEVTFVGVREVQENEQEGTILFFEDGASTGGRIQLRRKRAGLDVDVAWLTGDVSVRRSEQDARSLAR